jgi:hypothetical protein
MTIVRQFDFAVRSRPSDLVERCRRVMFLSAFVVIGMAAANAEVVPYFGGPDSSKLALNAASGARNAFLATLNSYGVEDLEDLSGANPTLTFGTTGITAATGFSNGVNTFYPYSVSGVNFLWDAEGASDWLAFSEPVTAFGSYVVQGGDGSSAPPTSTPTNTLTLRIENTILGTSKNIFIQSLGPDWPFYNVIFVGVTDTMPFNRVSLVESFDHDGLLWDDLVAGFVTPPLSGDFDKNDVVDANDLVTWSDHYGEQGNGDFLSGDGDGDGDTDGRDFLVWQRQFGQMLAGDIAAVNAVPEPSGLIMAVAGLVFLVGRRQS